MPVCAQVEAILAAEGAVVELEESPPLGDLMSVLGFEGCRVALLDRAPVFDKETLLHGIYQACAFPAYFGFNWDALSDALVECASADARPLVLIVRDLALLRMRAPEVAQTFLDVVADVHALTEGDLLRLVVLPGDGRSSREWPSTL
jgi:RNAse (barnase) inhibitor barstar